MARPLEVLIIDDDPGFGQDLAILLDSLGMRTDHEERAPAVIRQVSGGRVPDLLLIKLEQRDFPTRSACMALRGEPQARDLPILLYSAQPVPDPSEELQACGAQGLLSIPFSPARVLYWLNQNKHRFRGAVDIPPLPEDARLSPRRALVTRAGETQAPRRPEGPASIPPARPGGFLSVPPARREAPASMPPARPGGFLSVPPSQREAPASVPPARPGSFLSVPPSQRGASLPPPPPEASRSAPSDRPRRRAVPPGMPTPSVPPPAPGRPASPGPELDEARIQAAPPSSSSLAEAARRRRVQARRAERGRARSVRKLDPSSGIHVLLVDDEPLVLEMLTDILGEEGYVLRRAEDWTSFRKAITMTVFGVILLDVRLTAEGGGDRIAEFVQRFVEPPKPRIYLHSGLPEEELSRLARELGVDGYLCKGCGEEPIRDAVLAGAVQFAQDWESLSGARRD